MPVNSNPADTVTRYLGSDSNISVAQLGNISAVEAIAAEINDVSSGLTQLTNSMAQLQKMQQAAVAEEQNRQGVVNALASQVADAQAKVASETPTSSNSSTNSQLTADQSTLAGLQGQLGTATFNLQAQQGYVASLQQQIDALQTQINSAQTQLNNLRTQAMPAAQQVDDQSREQQQSTNTSSQDGAPNSASPAQMTLAARLRAQLTPGNTAASILDGLPYDQERQQPGGDGGGGGGGGGGGAGGGGANAGSAGGGGGGGPNT